MRFLVESGGTFFAEVTTKHFRRRAFRSVRQLDQALYDYLEEYNANPKPLSMGRPGPHLKNTAGVQSEVRPWSWSKLATDPTKIIERWNPALPASDYFVRPFLLPGSQNEAFHKRVIFQDFALDRDELVDRQVQRMPSSVF